MADRGRVVHDTPCDLTNAIGLTVSIILNGAEAIDKQAF
jgi:hypothetical protein